MIWIIVLAVIIFIVYRKRKLASNAIASVAYLDDFTLSDNEKDIANILKEMVISLERSPELAFDRNANYDRAISEIALAIFKSGMWRLNDKKLANSYFNNPGYIKVNTQKFTNDVNRKIREDYFEYKSLDFFEQYILYWVIKFKDDAKAINSFLG